VNYSNIPMNSVISVTTAIIVISQVRELPDNLTQLLITFINPVGFTFPRWKQSFYTEILSGYSCSLWSISQFGIYDSGFL